MKHYLKLSLTALILISALAFTTTKMNVSNPKNKRVEVVFSPGSTLEGLVKIQKNMAAKGVALKYQNLRFNEYGNLTAIHFTVDFGDGFSGSAGTDMISYSIRFGFYRDYSENAETPFGAGGF